MWIELMRHGSPYLFNVATGAECDGYSASSECYFKINQHTKVISIGYDEIKQKIFEAQNNNRKSENYKRDEMAYTDPKTHWPD